MRSFFFRDKTPFEHFRADDHAGAAGGAARLRAPSASGARRRPPARSPIRWPCASRRSEPQIAGWRIELLATDLSGEVLEKARAGLYTQFEVQRGLPIQLLVKHFAQFGELWQIAPDIRAMVKYRQLNLLADFSQLGTFDLVFCRNVLIYFDQDTKTDVLNRLARVIAGDGYLVLGAAETVVGLTDRFKMVPDKRGLYVPERRPAAGSPASGRSPARGWSPSTAGDRAHTDASGSTNKNPGREAGVLQFRSYAYSLGRNFDLVLGRLAQHVAAAPHRFDVVLAVRGVGELFAQLADEDVDDLQLRLVHAAIEVIEEHFLGQRRAFAQAKGVPASGTPCRSGARGRR